MWVEIGAGEGEGMGTGGNPVLYIIMFLGIIVTLIIMTRIIFQ